MIKLMYIQVPHQYTDTNSWFGLNGECVEVTFPHDKKGFHRVPITPNNTRLSQIPKGIWIQRHYQKDLLCISKDFLSEMNSTNLLSLLRKD